VRQSDYAGALNQAGKVIDRFATIPSSPSPSGWK